MLRPAADLEHLETVLRELAIAPVASSALDVKLRNHYLAQYSADDKWYRAKVTSVNPRESTVDVLYIDYGNVSCCCIRVAAVLECCDGECAAFARQLLTWS